MPSRLVFDTHSNVKAEAACLRKHHIEEKAPLNRKELETTSSRRRAAASLLAILPQREKKECRPHHGDFHLGGSFGLLFRLVGYENPQFLQGTDAYPVPSLFLSPFFVCYATQNGITCGTTMAATRKQGVSKLNDLHNSQVLK